MTHLLTPTKHKPHTTDHHLDSIPPSPSPPRSIWSRFANWVQFLLCLVLTGGVLVYLLWTPETGASKAAALQPTASEAAVRLAGPRDISIRPDSPLCKRLQVVDVTPVRISAPVLNVTGVVAASLRPGNGKGSDHWQFNSSELLTTFTDWQKATADVTFTETQLVEIKQLAETRATAQEKLVQQMKKLVEAGTDTPKDLAAAEAELMQAQIEGRKEIHEAETAVRLAQRSEATLARQLQQAGLDPELLQSSAADIDVVLADVPEGLVARVKLGQACQAKFFGFPDQTFTGKVRAIAPVLSEERRSLRVLFAISDPTDQLRPGMFADIGLGTDARDTLLVPPEGIVHVGRADYVLVDSGNDHWRVTQVEIGELHQQGMEIVAGLQAGDKVAGRGVILLKPYIIQALQASESDSPRPTHASSVRLGESS